MEKIKIEVEMSLEDFFNSDLERDNSFKQAMQESILRMLNNHEFVQKNIAHYLFKHFKDEIFKSEMDKIEVAIRDAIERHKQPEKWDITSNDVFKSTIDRALNDMSGEIYDATQKIALEMLLDEGRDYNSLYGKVSRDYNSLYGKVSDAMVDKVFDHFVDAMVKREESKR